MMNRRISHLACYLLTAVSTLGSDGVLAEKMQQHKTVDQSHPRARLIVGSEGLYDQIRLVKARVAPLGNFMRGQAAVHNLTDNRLMLEYKIDWMDDEGFLIADGGIWERFALGPRELRPFKSLGKSKHAARMQFTVRFPGDTFIDSSARWKDDDK